MRSTVHKHPHISLSCRSCSKSQVCSSGGSIPFSAIDLLLWPFAFHFLPCQTTQMFSYFYVLLCSALLLYLWVSLLNICCWWIMFFFIHFQCPNKNLQESAFAIHWMTLYDSSNVINCIWEQKFIRQETTLVKRSENKNNLTVDVLGIKSCLHFRKGSMLGKTKDHIQRCVRNSWMKRDKEIHKDIQKTLALDSKYSAWA